MCCKKRSSPLAVTATSPKLTGSRQMLGTNTALMLPYGWPRAALLSAVQLYLESVGLFRQTTDLLAEQPMSTIELSIKFELSSVLSPRSSSRPITQCSPERHCGHLTTDRRIWQVLCKADLPAPAEKCWGMQSDTNYVHLQGGGKNMTLYKVF